MSDFFVHPSSYVDEPCTIGAGTKIWFFCHISRDCSIGECCNIGQNVYVGEGVKIGRNVKIQNNVSVYSGVTLEDDVFCGPSCVFTNVGSPRSQIVRRARYEKTLVRRGATLGANSTIVCGTTIGEFAFIGAGAVVTKDVPRYALVAGVPARQIGWAGRHGYRLEAGKTAGSFRCPESGFCYELGSGGELRCLDLEESKPLPP